MKKILIHLSLAVCTAGLALMGGCGSDDEGGGKELGASSGTWMEYPYTEMGNPAAVNPAKGIAGSAKALEAGAGKMRLELNVSGLLPMRAYGAHLHKLACDDTMAGGHYQHNPAPAGMANDPAFGNATNEAWLDFTTDAMGKASATAMVDWVPTAAAAKSIVVHFMATGSGGMAGAKLACLPMTFK
jgi:Cu-Zn family superoxide dismutase